MGRGEDLWMTLNEFLGGLMAGFTQVIVGQPFDTVKVRLQACHRFSSVRDCIKETYKNQGVTAFFKGALSPLIGTGFIVSIEMGVNEVLKSFMKQYFGEQRLSYSLLFLSGCLAGLAGSLITTPVEHGKIRMQMQMEENTRYSGSIDALKQIYRSHGIVGVYKGFTITCIRELIPSGVYYLSYEWARRYFKKSKEIKFLEIYPCGLIAGTLFWIISYPIDIVKTKVQYDRFSVPKYHGIQGIIKATKEISSEGWGKQLSGFYACMLRATPVYGISFYVFQKTIQILTNIERLNIMYD